MLKGVVKMEFISYEELENIECDENVDEVVFNGVSGIDGFSKWHTIYYLNGDEKDVYIK